MTTARATTRSARHRRERQSPNDWSIKKRRNFFNPLGDSSPQFAVLAVFMVAVFAMGGSARGDIQSLMVLRPLAALTLGYGLTSLNLGHVKAYRWLFGLAVACVALVLFQLTLLPSATSYALPGHNVIADIDRATGNYGLSRPISMAPTQTWNSLWSIMAPLAVLVLGVQMSAAEHRKLLSIVVVIGIFSAGLGLAQTVSEQQGLLYPYDDMGRGLPVGLLTNRNCQAVFLASLLPMLGVWARLYEPEISRRGRKISITMVGAAIVGICLVPIILLTGSRMGAATSVLACLATPFVVRSAKRANKTSEIPSRVAQLMKWLPLAGVAGAATLVTLTIRDDRAASINRLFGQSISDDLRIQILPTLRTVIGQHWIWGTGLGTFKLVYRVFEPNSVLMSMIMNHAHNDWLEVIMTAGIGGVLIVLVAATLWLSRLISVFRTKAVKHPLYLARIGLLTVLLFAFSSITDYHMRTPSIACLMALIAVWSGIESLPPLVANEANTS